MADENKKVSAENTKPAKQVKDKKAEKPAKTAKVKDKNLTYSYVWAGV